MENGRFYENENFVKLRSWSHHKAGEREVDACSQYISRRGIWDPRSSFKNAVVNVCTRSEICSEKSRKS